MHTKDFEAKYNKVKAKLTLLSSSASAPGSSSGKNKGLIVESYDCDEEEVSSDDNEVPEVKALMALTDEERVSVSKESARNGEGIKISMKKVHTLLEMKDNDDRKSFLDYLRIDLNYVEEQRNNLISKHRNLVQELNTCKEQLLVLKKAKLDLLTMQHVNTEILKENQNLRNKLKELTSIYRSMAKQYLQLWAKRPVFVKSVADNSDVSITGSNKHKLSEAEDSTLSNHGTGKVLSNESQRNTTDHSVVISDSSATNYDSADESSVCSTPFPPLEKLTGVEPVFGPKTIKSILKSKSTFKAEILKGFTINEPSSAPAIGNKSSSVSKTNSAPAGNYDHDTHGHNNIISLRRGIKPRNPQHVTKNCKTCGSNVHITFDHNDNEWFRKREALQAKKIESFKASKIESSSALRSRTPTKRMVYSAIGKKDEGTRMCSWLLCLRIGRKDEGVKMHKEFVVQLGPEKLSRRRRTRMLHRKFEHPGRGSLRFLPREHASKKVPSATLYTLNPGLSTKEELAFLRRRACINPFLQLHKYVVRLKHLTPLPESLLHSSQENLALLRSYPFFRECLAISSASFILHTVESALGHDASTDSTSKADPGISALSDFVPQQQGMNEGTKNTSYDHIIAGSNPSVLVDKTKSARDGLKTAHTTSGENKTSRADDISRKVKLEDLSDILKDTRSAFFTPDSPTDEPIIVLDESEEDEEVAKDKDTEDTSVPPPPSPKSAQIQELMAQVHLLHLNYKKLFASHDFASCLPTELKELPSKITELSREIKELKQHVKDMEIELPRDLVEIPTKLETFTSTISSLSSQVAELKNIQWKLPTEFLNFPSQVSSVQEKLQTLDSLPSLLHKVTDTLNKFSTMVYNASGATSMHVPSPGQTTASPAEGEKNTEDAASVAEVPSALALQVLRRLGSIFNSVYAAVQKLKKVSWKELQFSLVEISNLNVVYLLNKS
ncbi:hypothetical protein Tco_0933895 [Tanacetum coccineum]